MVRPINVCGHDKFVMALAGDVFCALRRSIECRSVALAPGAHHRDTLRVRRASFSGRAKAFQACAYVANALRSLVALSTDNPQAFAIAVAHRPSDRNGTGNTSLIGRILLVIRNVRALPA